MPVIRLTDPDDDRLADYTRLTDVALRRRLETERGLYMAESSNVIARAVAAGHRPRSFLMAERWLASMAPTIAAACGGMPDGGAHVPVFVAEEPLLQQITGFHLHRGALAAMHRPVLPEVAHVLADGPARLAVFEDIVDHTNLGAAFRSAAALGVGAVLVTESCADPLYRRSIRVSMGTVFQVPWTRVVWPSGLDLLREHGYVTAALALSDDAITLDELAAMNPPHLAMVFGTEGHGLRPRTLKGVDHIVRVPMSHGVDSLNVAAAAAVTFYATRAR